MQIQIRWGKLDASDALAAHIEKEVEQALEHTRERFTRVEVHLHDDNADKGGPQDKRCVIELRPRAADPISVEGASDDMYKTVTTVAKKLGRVARNFVDKRRNH